MSPHRIRLSLILPLVAAVIGCGGDEPVGPELSGRVAAAGGITATAVSHSRIDLAWQDNAGNESGWDVHRSTTGQAGAFTFLARLGANSTAYTNAGLQPGTQYCYKVRSFRITGSKTSYAAFSATACATTPAQPVPAAPSDLFVTPEGSARIYVSWRDNSTNEDGFRVERTTDAGASWSVAVLSLGAWDSGRASEQEACYRVFAFNAGGDSPPSPTACNTPPAAPTNLTAIMTDSGFATLTWTDNSAVEDGYEIWQTELNEWGEVLGPFHIGDVPANATDYQAACCAYYFLVRAAKNWFGFSDFSNQAYPVAPGTSIHAIRRLP